MKKTAKFFTGPIDFVWNTPLRYSSYDNLNLCNYKWVLWILCSCNVLQKVTIDRTTKSGQIVSTSRHENTHVVKFVSESGRFFSWRLPGLTCSVEWKHDGRRNLPTLEWHCLVMAATRVRCRRAGCKGKEMWVIDVVGGGGGGGGGKGEMNKNKNKRKERTRKKNMNKNLEKGGKRRQKKKRWTTKNSQNKNKGKRK